MGQFSFKGMLEAAQGFLSLSAVRQLGMLIGLSVSIALGFWVVLWSKDSAYHPLVSGVSGVQAGEILELLTEAGINYRLNEANGAITVPANDVYRARIKLATEGYPRNTTQGFELLEQPQGFGTSQFIETARYQRAIEGELAKSIASIQSVDTARVHLAIPKQTSFVRKRKKPSASIVISLVSGRSLSDDQLAGVVNLVSSSVPELLAENVSVIDQNGSLLTNSPHSGGVGLNNSQYNYVRRVEDGYIEKIENILSPIVGPGRIRAQVVADIDFSVNEQTSEIYDPDEKQIRSASVSTQEQSGNYGAMGIPGSLTNTPPDDGEIVSETSSAEVQADADTASSAQNVNREPRSRGETTRHNYELDKTISHTRASVGNVRRISVAIVVDDSVRAIANADSVTDAQAAAGNGESSAVSSAYSDEDIERLEKLAKDAIGFSAERGDTVTVLAVPFSKQDAIEPIAEAPIWQQPWALDGLRVIVACVVLLLLVLMVLRPAMQTLARAGRESGARLGDPGERDASIGQFDAAGELISAGSERSDAGQSQLGTQEDQPRLSQDANANTGYEEKLATIRNLVANDPNRVAHVLRTWIVEE